MINAFKRAIWIYLLSICMVSYSHGSELYEYRGNNYTYFYPLAGNIYNNSMSISFNFMVRRPLINASVDLNDIAINYSFMDGIHTITEKTGKIGGYLSTDASGNPVLWDVDISNRDTLDPTLKTGDQIVTPRSRQGLNSFEDTVQIYQCVVIVAGSCYFDLAYEASSLSVGNWTITHIPDLPDITPVYDLLLDE